MDRELERIYGYNSDPNSGKWFVSDNHNYVRYIGDFREIIHQVIPMNNHDDPTRGLYCDYKLWTVSIGGPENKFQVGTNYFQTTKDAKKWADNRDMESLHYLEMLIDSWR